MGLVEQRQRSAEWNARRGEVLMTAAALIASRGIKAVSMRDIASHAALHASTIYYYFENKEGLYRAVCGWAFGRVSSVALDALRSGGTARTRLARLVEAAVTFLVDDELAARIIDQELVLGRGGLSDTSYPDTTRAPTIELAKLMTELDVALLAHMPARRLAELLWNMIYGVVRFSPANRRVMEDEEPQTGKETLVGELQLVIGRMLYDD